MTGDEHQAQEVVAAAVVDGGGEIRRGRFSPGLDLATELVVLALEPLDAPRKPPRRPIRASSAAGARPRAGGD
jgi:hypothetical protein